MKDESKSQAFRDRATFLRDRPASQQAHKTQKLTPAHIGITRKRVAGVLPNISNMIQ